MKEAYPVLIKQCGKEYLVYVPDLELYTEGKSMADAMEMARDAIGLKGVDYMKDAKALPKPSNATEVINKAKEEADKRGVNYSRLLQEALLAFLGGTQSAKLK